MRTDDAEVRLLAVAGSLAALAVFLLLVGRWLERVDHRQCEFANVTHVP